MGKLQLMILFFIAFSLCLHIKKGRGDKAYLKKLIMGNVNSKNRIVYLDYIRLIATLFVLLVHCLDGAGAISPIDRTAFIVRQSLISILFVCNPLFIMNSGALILNQTADSLKTFYYKRFFHVAIPFFCYYGIYILLASRYFTSGFFKGLLHAARDMAAGPIDWTPHLWVIYVILSLYIFAPFFSILLKHLSPAMLHGLAVLILLFQCVAVYLPVFGLPVNVQLMISPWLGVFLLGYYFSHPVSLSRRRLYGILGLVSLAGTVLCVAYRQDYSAILLAEGAPMMILIAGAIFLLLRSIETILPKPKTLMKIVVRYSYSILLVHWAVLYFVLEPMGMGQNPWLAFVLVLVFSTAAAILFDQTVVFCIQSLVKIPARLLRNKNT